MPIWYQNGIHVSWIISLRYIQLAPIIHIALLQLDFVAMQDIDKSIHKSTLLINVTLFQCRTASANCINQSELFLTCSIWNSNDHNSTKPLLPKSHHIIKAVMSHTSQLPAWKNLSMPVVQMTAICFSSVVKYVPSYSSDVL